MGRRAKGNKVMVDADGYVHVEVNGCRIVLPPSAEHRARADAKAKMRQVRLRFPAAVKAETHA